MLLADPWTKGKDVSNARRALVVDDDPTARLMLKSLLSRSGYDVTLAVNGVEALERFAQLMPDIVFMDMRMPQMDGLQAAARIKELSPNEFVPVIFVTGASETEDLVRGIEAGADDFMTKPFDQRVLAAKIRAMERIRDLHRSAARLHAQAQADWEVAQSLLSEVVMGPNPRPPALHVDLVPTANFSGDIFLAEHCPSGDLNLLLGDFTGHGLAAAVAALPTAETFRSMTAKGFAPNQILIEINRKLRAQLPTGKFLAAVFIQVSRSLERVWAINCGMPDVLLCSDKGIRARIASSTLPLAVLREPDLGDGLRPYPIEPGERLILASDGVHEAANAAGEQFGRARLENAATVATAGESASVRIKAELDAFRGRQPITDDATLVEAVLVPELFAAYQPPALGWARPGAPASASGQWRMALDLHADALRVSDPVPMILSQLRDIPGINEHLSVLYTVLSELYSNALEHGVLGLSSSLKNEPEGFERYLAARERELAALREGWVRISAVCAQWPGGGQLVFRIEDSGAGFDWRARPADAPHDPHGRGLNLVRGLCRTVSFEGEGNQVCATYAWGAGRREDAAA